MDDQGILQRIQSLVEEERELRRRLKAAGDEDGPDRARIQSLEDELDQAWDLLRQRRAKSRHGENPDEAEARPINQVRSYKG